MKTFAVCDSEFSIFFSATMIVKQHQAAAGVQYHEFSDVTGITEMLPGPAGDP